MGYIVGLTGGIGSGKSAASQWFAAQGIVVVDADVVAKEVVQPGTQLLGQIQASFGDWVLLADGALNRPALREHIFNHPAARQQLEALTHPAIRQELLRQLQTARSPYVLLVSPLLFETGQHQLSQRTLLIDVPESLQLQRASQRDGQSPAQIEKIMAIQMPRAQKQQLADDVVSNHLDLAHLYQQLQQRHQHYLHLAQAA
jgi:dephospho-CoA kinase